MSSYAKTGYAMVGAPGGMRLYSLREERKGGRGELVEGGIQNEDSNINSIYSKLKTRVRK